MIRCISRPAWLVTLCGIVIGMLLATGCTTTRVTVSCKGLPEQTAKNDNSREWKTDRGHKLTSCQKKILDEAMSWLGTPYAYARAEKGKGTDCSGLVMRVYEDALEYKIPRNSARQAEFCEWVEPDKMRSGDLVFFATGKKRDCVSHVGIILGDDRFIHCSTSRGVVVTSLSAPYYAERLLKIGRLPMLNAYK